MTEQHNAGSDLKAAVHRKASFLQTMQAVAWSFFGVRKSADYAKDVSQLNPVHLVIAGVLGADDLLGPRAYIRQKRCAGVVVDDLIVGKREARRRRAPKHVSRESGRACGDLFVGNLAAARAPHEVRPLDTSDGSVRADRLCCDSHQITTD